MDKVIILNGNNMDILLIIIDIVMSSRLHDSFISWREFCYHHKVQVIKAKISY